MLEHNIDLRIKHHVSRSTFTYRASRITNLTRGAQQRLLHDQIVARGPVGRALAQDRGHKCLQLKLIQPLTRLLLQRDELLAALVAAMRLGQTQSQRPSRLEWL